MGGFHYFSCFSFSFLFDSSFVTLKQLYLYSSSENIFLFRSCCDCSVYVVCILNFFQFLLVVIILLFLLNLNSAQIPQMVLTCFSLLFNFEWFEFLIILILFPLIVGLICYSELSIFFVLLWLAGDVTNLIGVILTNGFIKILFCSFSTLISKKFTFFFSYFQKTIAV